MKQVGLRSRRSRPPRDGIAAVELAICLPVIVLLVLGLIETCTMTFLKQSLAVAAYEGAHTALKPDATAAEVRQTCQQILQDRRVKGASINISPSDLARLDEGEFFEVRISAPSDLHGVLPVRFFRGKTLTGSAEMMKEL